MNRNPKEKDSTASRSRTSSPAKGGGVHQRCTGRQPNSLVRKALNDRSVVQRLYRLEVGEGYGESMDYFRANDLERKLRQHLDMVDSSSKDLDARSEASKYIAVICLCRSSLVYLLWSHYADSHRGCAIGVDVWHKSFARARLNERVQYSKKRPTREVDREGAAFFEELKKLTRTKSHVWSYEREYRLAFPIEELEHDKEHCFVALHPQAVRRVIYGDQLDSEWKGRIDGLLSCSDYRHVRLYEVKRDPKDYLLRLSRLR